MCFIIKCSLGAFVGKSSRGNGWEVKISFPFPITSVKHINSQRARVFGTVQLFLDCFEASISAVPCLQFHYAGIQCLILTVFQESSLWSFSILPYGFILFSYPSRLTTLSYFHPVIVLWLFNILSLSFSLVILGESRILSLPLLFLMFEKIASTNPRCVYISVWVWIMCTFEAVFASPSPCFHSHWGAC